MAEPHTGFSPTPTLGPQSGQETSGSSSDARPIATQHVRQMAAAIDQRINKLHAAPAPRVSTANAVSSTRDADLADYAARDDVISVASDQTVSSSESSLHRQMQLLKRRRELKQLEIEELMIAEELSRKDSDAGSYVSRRSRNSRRDARRREQDLELDLSIPNT